MAYILAVVDLLAQAFISIAQAFISIAQAFISIA
jgi:hypothetical protein